jgi:hypothetical protein
MLALFLALFASLTQKGSKKGKFHYLELHFATIKLVKSLHPNVHCTVHTQRYNLYVHTHVRIIQITFGEKKNQIILEC